MRIPRVLNTPRIEGDLAQEVWRQAPWYGTFSIAGEPGREANPQTSFSMLHNGDNLYIAIKAEEPQVRMIKAEIEVPEHLAGSDNGLEIFLDAEGKSVTYAHLTVNSIGTLSTAWCIKGAPGRDQRWAPPVQYNTYVESDWWGVQLAFPLAHLHFTNDSSFWGVNVTRTRILKEPGPVTPSPYSTFAPLERANFHQPRAFVPAQIEQLDFSHFLWDVKPLGGAELSAGEDGTVYRREFLIVNRSPTPRSVEIRCALDGGTASGREVTCEAELHSHQRESKTVEFVIPNEEHGDIWLSIRDVIDGRELFQRNYVHDEDLTWRQHFIKRGDGCGGYVCREALFQFAPLYQGERVNPYGLAAMDHGEIALIGLAKGRKPERVVIAFSNDGGANWSDFEPVGQGIDPPGMFAWLGNGVLSYNGRWSGESGLWKIFSYDFGRTWRDRVPLQRTMQGDLFETEGNPLIDRDDRGVAVRIAETGYNWANGPWPSAPTRELFRWSSDGGRTWHGEVIPESWQWKESWEGKTYTRGCGEGSLVRSANGWIVAALRTDLEIRHVKRNANDTCEGVGVSISRDNGVTWSPIRRLFRAGRHHPQVLRLPTGELVMTLIRRVDMRNGKLASYRRGCDALISRDSGVSWNEQQMYVLDEYEYYDNASWDEGKCGHHASVLLEDGSILTAYGQYLCGTALIRWRP